MTDAYTLFKKPGSRLTTLLLLAAILIGAFGARTWGAYDYIFANPDEIKLLGVDSLFHLRHAKYTLVHYPEIQRMDIGASYPDVRQNHATGLFGFAISSVALMLYGSDASLNDIAAVAVWFTPLLAVIAYLLLFILVRQLTNTSVGLLATLFFLLYPGKSLDRSVLGFVDHHAAEFCLSLAIAIGMVFLLRVTREQRQGTLWKPILLAALPLVILIYTWQGAALVVLLINIAFFAYWSVLQARAEQISEVTKASALYGLVLLLSLWFVPGNQVFLAIGAVMLIVGAWCYSRIQQYLALRFSAAAVAGIIFILVLFVAAIVACFTELGLLLVSLVLSESTNFIHEESTVSSAKFIEQFGVVGIVAIAGLVLLPVMVCKRRLSPETIVPVTLGGCWLLIWYLSGDFDYAVPPFIAVLASLTCYSFWLLLEKTVSGKSVVTSVCIKVVVLVLGFAFLILPVYPFKALSLPWVEESKLQAMTIYHQAWYRSLTWLEQHSPQPARTPLSHPDSPVVAADSEQSDYGIMVAWDYGNLVASHGNRIPVWSSLPSNYIPRWLLAQSEQESLEVLSERFTNERTIRYVIVDKDTYGPLIHAKSKFTDKPVEAVRHGEINVNGKQVPYITLDNTHKNSMIARLYANDGSELSHYRMVYESSAQTYSTGFLQLSGTGDKLNYTFVPKTFPIDTPDELQRYQQWTKVDVVDTGNGYLYNGQIHSTIKIFEIVRGTIIKGQAGPGDQIQARLSLRSKTTGRQFMFNRTAIADGQGNFEFAVPYSTEQSLSDSDIIAEGDYQLWVRPKGTDSFSLKATMTVPESSFKDRKLLFTPELYQ
ncbi:STT3 domain-containing protein [Planctobacterium marinum]|uniref:STT3 domain-containing protein n=1 Tax=Planctobacterium marinum TaxID=1631968 RepID=UPI001E402C43|nr:STT3 domain-containing protein [Planctobacterium marinum]MCC2607944.1 hypothetical protein [Planctobacterium marinum]